MVLLVSLMMTVPNAAAFKKGKDGGSTGGDPNDPNDPPVSWSFFGGPVYGCNEYSWWGLEGVRIKAEFRAVQNGFVCDVAVTTWSYELIPGLGWYKLWLNDTNIDPEDIKWNEGVTITADLGGYWTQTAGPFHYYQCCQIKLPQNQVSYIYPIQIYALTDHVTRISYTQTTFHEEELWFLIGGTYEFGCTKGHSVANGLAVNDPGQDLISRVGYMSTGIIRYEDSENCLDPVVDSAWIYGDPVPPYNQPDYVETQTYDGEFGIPSIPPNFQAQEVYSAWRSPNAIWELTITELSATFWGLQSEIKVPIPGLTEIPVLKCGYRNTDGTVDGVYIEIENADDVAHQYTVGVAGSTIIIYCSQ